MSLLKIISHRLILIICTNSSDNEFVKDQLAPSHPHHLHQFL
jgi:hypothetical protein